jgi:hypothetical protein
MTRVFADAPFYSIAARIFPMASSTAMTVTA